MKTKKYKEEQLKFFGNIIEFPNKKFKEMQDKYYVAIKLLKYIADAGYDFSITIDREAAEKIFKKEDLDKKHVELMVLTTSKEFEKNTKYKRKSFYFIEGNEDIK